MFERLADTARDAITSSADEAARRGDRRIGTEHLLLGILHDPAIVRVLGTDLGRARAELAGSDARALAAIGIDVGEFRPPETTSRPRRTAFSSGARAVIPRALSLATQERARRISTAHLLLALLDGEEPDAAAALLAGLKVDPVEVRRRLAAA